MDPSVCVDALRDICEQNATQLFEMWHRIGYPRSKIEDYGQIVQRNVAELLQEMVDEVNENQSKLLSDIEKLREEAILLSKEVGADYETLTAGLEDKSVPLIGVADTLKGRIQELRNKKDELLDEYSELLKTEEKLCHSLSLPKQPKILGVPNQKSLEKFSMYLQQKIEEEKKLRQQYVELKGKIECIRNELAMEPDTSFYKHLVSGNMCLSPENMMLLQSLYETMIQQLEMAKEKSVKLREKLANLWDRLQIPLEDRDAFLAQYPGYSLKAINALEAEIKRCEDQKQQNIQMFVDTIRKEIEDWWCKCCFGEQQRRNFRAFYSDWYTEDLLDLHELEAERLRIYFQNNHHILDLTQKWNELWEKMVELDIKAHDPKRLFGNRGGQLLHEEKERKTLQKQLPHIKGELTKYIDEFGKNQKSPFLYMDLKLKELINDQWKEWHKRKKTEKEARKRGRDGSGEMETNRVKPLLVKKPKIAQNTPVPESLTKRKLAPSKVVRMILFTKDNNTPGAPSGRITKPEDCGITYQDPSYFKFQAGLEKKTAIDRVARSTELPNQYLQE